MSAAYGSGAVRRWPALLLVAVCALTGAVMAGQNVAVTLGNDLLPGLTLPAISAAIILGAACLTLFVANLAGIPLSTSEVTVGSVVGTALVLGTPAWWKIGMIVANWAVVPLISFSVAYLLQKHFGKRLRPYARGKRRLLAVILTLGGCYEAFAAGANNVANAVGPLIGARLIPMEAGILAGGVGLALGAVTLGGGVLNTNAKKITTLDLLSGSMVSFTGATLVVLVSLLGLPTPLTQVTTLGIVGVGYANGGVSALNPTTLRRVATVWLVSPVLSLAISYLGAALLLPNVPTPAPGITAAVVGSAALSLLIGHRLLRGERTLPVPAAKQPAAADDRAAEELSEAD